MQCLSCESENQQLAKFCGECGASLGRKCPQCELVNAPENNFCNDCGHTLAEEAGDEASAVVTPANRKSVAAAAAVETDVNRRQMSFLCCDLEDSVMLARGLDPEDLRYALNNFHGISKTLIEEYGGYYGQYMGDGFMAYFSYPIAHEDDAYRAVLTGLRIVDEIQKFNVELTEKHGVQLHLRVGIATGAVVVDDRVAGEPPNIASRAQSVASRDTVVITENTKRLLPPGGFSYEDLGIHHLKNVEPMRLFRVVGRTMTNGPSLRSYMKRPLVGRGKELGLLMEQWERVKGGEGQAVIVAGEAGIGKSKLIHALETAIGTEAHICLRFQGSPFHENTMLHPVIEHLQLAAQTSAADDDQDKRAKLQVLLSQFDGAENMLPLMIRLLPQSGPSDSPGTPPQRLRRQTLNACTDMVLQQARHGPVLIILEDMHWIDSTTMELLELLIPLLKTERILLVMATRSSFTSELQAKYYLTQITLIRLQANDVKNMIHDITGGKVLPEGVHGQIMSKANGVPLFVEELTKMVLDSDFIREVDNQYRLVGEPNFTIPLTLLDLLTSRVDRVRGRKVLQLAATIGRRFSYQLLAAISSLDAEFLASELRQLVDAELIYQKGSTLQSASFEFKHALIRDAAYSLLTMADRESYHEKIGLVFEERFPEVLEANPEVVAHHFSEAKKCEKAIQYWFEAGRRSAAGSAHTEAIGHLEQGVELLSGVADQAERNKLELLLQTTLGNSLRATKGWSVPSVKKAYTRALELSGENSFDQHTFPAIFGLWTWSFAHGAFEEAQSTAAHLLHITESLNDPIYKVIAHEVQGFTLFGKGDFSAAHAALKHSISLCDDDAGADYINLSAQDPRVHVRLYEGMVLWFLGFPDQAVNSCLAARQYADALQHPFSQAMARSISLRLHQLRGDVEFIAANADTAIALCDDHDFAHYSAMARILRGWAVAKQGQFERGIAEIQAGLEKVRSTGAVLYESYILALLAEACIIGKQFDQALSALDQAQLRTAQENSERFYAAEIYRLQGEVYMQSGQNLASAEHCFNKGLAIVREQKARSLKLKICTSLYDLDLLNGRSDQSRTELEAVYKSFDEGFETADLIKAKSRLAAGQ